MLQKLYSATRHVFWPNCYHHFVLWCDIDITKSVIWYLCHHFSTLIWHFYCHVWPFWHFVTISMTSPEISVTRSVSQSDISVSRCVFCLIFLSSGWYLELIILGRNFLLLTRFLWSHIAVTRSVIELVSLSLGLYPDVTVIRSVPWCHCH